MSGRRARLAAAMKARNGRKVRLAATMAALHDRSSNHRAALASAGRFACFYCGRRLPVSELTEWIDDGRTALCVCGIDAVLPDPDDAPISEEQLRAMRDYWFWPRRWEHES